MGKLLYTQNQKESKRWEWRGVGIEQLVGRQVASEMVPETVVAQANQY